MSLRGVIFDYEPQQRELTPWGGKQLGKGLIGVPAGPNCSISEQTGSQHPNSTPFKVEDTEAQKSQVVFPHRIGKSSGLASNLLIPVSWPARA